MWRVLPVLLCLCVAAAVAADIADVQTGNVIW